MIKKEVLASVDELRGLFNPQEYGSVILPFVVTLQYTDTEPPVGVTKH